MGSLALRFAVVLSGISMTSCSRRGAEAPTPPATAVQQVAAKPAPPTASTASPCGTSCGLLDLCVDGNCRKNPFVQQELEPPRAVEPEPEPVIKAARCPFRKSKIPPEQTIADAKIPRFNSKKARFVDLSNPDTAEEESGDKLSTRVLDERLTSIHPRLMECIDLGACYSEEPLLGGDFEFALQIAGTGKITAASVTLSEPLRSRAVARCARQAASKVEFPRFKGTMAVRYAVTIK